MKKRISGKGIWKMLKQSFKGFMDDKVIKLSGSLAYFTIFSIGPMLIVIIYFADIFYRREAIEGSIYYQISGFVGPDAAAQIQNIIRNASASGQGTTTAILGFVTLFIGATGVFSEIQDSINSIWGLKPKPKKGFLKLLLNRLLSFSIVIALGFLLLVSLVLSAMMDALSNRLMRLFSESGVTIIYILNLVVTFLIISFLFAIIFKVLPDAMIKWRDVAVGAMVTAGLFMLGKFAISFYIGTSNIATTYGTAASIVVILSWVYYSSFILYFGAEFTKAYATQYGSLIKPNHYAVWVKTIEVENGRGTLKQQEQQKQDENESTGDHIKVK